VEAELALVSVVAESALPLVSLLAWASESAFLPAA
jgi:hypothetical protein